MSVDFGDINGARVESQRLFQIPPPLRVILAAKDVPAAEMWMQRNRQHPWLQPHRVTLFVQDHRFSTDLREVTYFIRCPRLNEAAAQLTPHERLVMGIAAQQAGQEVPQLEEPISAGHIANALWQYWEKPKPAPGEQESAWPDTVDQADIIEIDEGDWDEYLKAALRYAKDGNFICIGAPRCPMYFTNTALAFLDDQELHEHPDADVLDLFAEDHTRNTRGGDVE